MGPFDLTADWGTWSSYLVPMIIGIGFGAALEMSGFGDSRKLAAQFYLKDMTVLKVMFTGIIVAGTLLGFSSAVGLVNMDLVWINPTFLAPGIIGGLIMGIGFIVGGFCPGTSIVASSTLKIDGLVFAGGVALGILAFGETVGSYERFWTSSSMGRFTLADLFAVDTGVVLVGVVVMALVMFLAGEVAEAYFGRKTAAQNLRFLPRKPMAYVFGGALLLLATVTMARGQPNTERKWAQIADEAGVHLSDRSVFVHPMEIAEITQDTSVYTRVLDVRSEAHFNLFHLRNSRHVSLEELGNGTLVKSLRHAPANTVFFTVSNDETHAIAAWKHLSAESVANVYIAEGGINQWLRVFPPPPCLAKAVEGTHIDETVAFDFFRAVGDCCNSAYPEIEYKKLPFDCYLAANPDSSAAHSKAGEKPTPEPTVAFERKVKLKKKKAASGGCG